MSKQIRRNVFETNSSSMHSIAISNSNGLLDTLVVTDSLVVLDPMEFGWEIEEYSDALTKASYCWIYTNYKAQQSKRDMLIDVILEHTGADGVAMNRNDGDYFEEGYIDHQSSDCADEAFESKDSLRNFLFDPSSILRTDNDNH